MGRKGIAAMFGVLAALMGASEQADAQVNYGGYHLGPDYGAMINQQMQIMQQRNMQMQQMQNTIVQQNMQNPQVQAMYRQHLAQGGQMSFPQFAYMYAATGGFSQQGIQNYRNSESQNQRNEQNAYQGYLNAQRERGQAQQQYMDGYHRNNQEFGNTLQGNSTYSSPMTGQQVLPHTQPGQPYYDQNTGRTYVMNNLGQYFVRMPNGSWYPMQAMQ